MKSRLTAKVLGSWLAIALSVSAQVALSPKVSNEAAAASPFLVTAHTASGEAVPGAKVQVRSAGEIVKAGETGVDGSLNLAGLAPGKYVITIAAKGFDDLTAEIAFSAEANRIDAVLTATRAADSITVSETPEVALDQSPSPAGSFARDSVKNGVLKPITLADALPLLPGVIRLPNGELNLSGRGEHRSTLLVNDADATDPSTGNFGQTIPIDSVDTVNVLSSPFLAQYGGFSTSVVNVATRKAGDKWNFELNDPLPEFRIRSWDLQGLKTATPHLNFNGPLIKQKLYFSESVQYEMRNTNVITLPFPQNQQRREGLNTFTEIDYTINQNNILTATVHAAGQHTRFANLDAFNAEPVTPNTSNSTDSGSVTEHVTVRGMLIESGITFSHFTANVWPQTPDGMTMTPTGNFGSYFNQQARTAFRSEWKEDVSFTRELLGVHNLRFGTMLGGTALRAMVNDSPVDIRDNAGNLIETIRFAPGNSIHHNDMQSAVYGQDHWVVNPHLAIEAGLRAEQQRITRTFRLGPRAGVAWNPFSKTVVRAGMGVFYDRVPLNVYGFSSYPEQTITQYNPDGSLLAGPDTYLNLTAHAAQSLFPLVYEGRRNTAPGNFAPYSLNWNTQVEQTISANLRFRASFLQSSSEGLMTLNPQLLGTQHAFVLNGNGESFLRQAEFTAAVRTGKESEFYASYVHSRATGNLNEFSNYLANFPTAVILPDRYANLPGDVPNRFLLWGTFSLPKKLRIMPKAEYRTGFPYSPVDAFQNYVGMPDSHRYPGYFSFDTRISKDFKVNDKYSVRFSVTGSNLTDHFNPISVHANTADPAFGLFFGQYRRRYTADFDVLF